MVLKYKFYILTMPYSKSNTSGTRGCLTISLIFLDDFLNLKNHK